MAVTGINSEDQLVQATFAEHLEKELGWDSVFAWNQETFGPDSALGRTDTKEAVLTRDLRAALERLNPDLPAAAIEDAIRALTVYDISRSTVQHNRDFYRLIRGGASVTYRDAKGRQKGRNSQRDGQKSPLWFLTAHARLLLPYSGCFLQCSCPRLTGPIP